MAITKAQSELLALVGVTTESELWEKGQSFDGDSIEFEIFNLLIQAFWDFQSAEGNFASSVRSIHRAAETELKHMEEGYAASATWFGSYTRNAEESEAKMRAAVDQIKRFAHLLKKIHK